MRQLLSELRADGVQLWVHEGQLRIRSSRPLLQEQVAQLRNHKTDIISLLEEPPVSRTTPLAAGARSDPAPLSFQQEGLWFLDQLELLGPAYNLRKFTRIMGDLDSAALRRAFDELRRRHEVLRTRYRNVAGVGAQFVEPDGSVRFEETDLSGCEPEKRDARVRELLRSHPELVFYLERESPFIVQLFRLGANEHLLILNMHHIMMDGPSFTILFRELRALYGAFAAGAPSPLPEPRAQYADYSIWQRQWMQGEVLDAQLSYWRLRLAHAPESLDLPFDFVRPPLPDFNGAVVEISFPRELETSLQTLAREQDSTLFMALLAAFHMLLARWSGQKDICIGLPVDARGHREADELIGLFLNTIVVRADLSDNPSFVDVTRQVRMHLLGAYEHRDLPFDRLVAELRPERQLGRQPLFQVLFSYLVQEETTLPSLNLIEIEPEDRTAKFDLTLFFSETPDGLQAGFEYATSLFERTTIERLARYFISLLEGIVANPHAPLADLQLLEPSERHRLLVNWNETKFEYPATCIHEIFERCVARRPQATAVVFGRDSLSYAELNARANQLAHQLRRLDVGPDTLVGICVERSLEMVVGLLGILKAGAAYVPLDPAYPESRLSFMLNDSRAAVLVTQAHLLGLIPEAGAQVLCLDRDWSIIAANTTSNPAASRPQSLACCIYTSGSTGRPKGVALQHCNAVAFLAWAARTFSGDLDCVLFSTSICFDLSIFELFAPLTSGGTAVLVRDALVVTESPVEPAPLLINTVPSAAQALVDAAAIPSSVRVINLAGEPLRRELVAQIRAAATQARVYNLYGPSENTVYTTYCEVDGEAKITIGRPVANTQIYILDEYAEPVPIGSRGEIYAAGAGIARGYWDRPELTAERFLPNPFGAPGSRMYRTGDLGRYLLDGAIEFLGRVDHQVKIRGYRIELGEIESALLRCDGVRAAVVVADEDPSDGRRLVAYVVVRHRSDTSLRAQLQTTLPEFMVPATYVFLDALPLTPNGKIDRKALPVPGAGSNSRAQYVAPRTPTEGLLCEIWSEVLKVPRIGINDNFFELGGHSLLATQVVARIRQTLHAEVLLRHLFVALTVDQLARIVGSARAVADEPILRADAALPLVASFAQQRMWFLDQFEPESDLYNVAVAWRLRGLLDVAVLERCFTEIMRRHEVLRTVFDGDEGQPVPIVLDHTWLALAVTDLSGAADPEREAELRLETDVRRPFNLAQGPMTRVGLLRLGDQEHILMIAFHHVVADGWSLDVILTELATLYGAFADGNSSPLPELPIQYSDYARWQRELLQGDALQQHLGFWQRYLDGVPPVLALPTDHARPQVSKYRGDIVPFELSAELSGRLRELSQRKRVTLFMTMAAAFNVLLHRYSGQDDLCIGYSIGNRDRLEIEGLVGVFANTLVLRTRVGPRDTFEDELAHVRDSMLDADAHKDLPFEKLVEELRPERDLSRHPIFQVSYNYSTTHGSRARNNTTLPGLGQREVTLRGLEISLVEPKNQTAKFDLSLFISDTGAGRELEADFEYSSDLFEQHTIERLVNSFRILLEGIVADPTTPMAEVPLLAEAERHRLLVEWNAPALAPVETCLHQLFEQQAARSPDATAIIAAGHALSYAELNARANRFAHRLLTLGVGPDTLVGICVERSLEMVVGLLAILKAGGAYVPLDPAYPAARLEQMLADSGASVLLTQARLGDKLQGHGFQVLHLDADAPHLADAPATNLRCLTRPSNLAYCIYTSGSTGRPKGVALTHANAVAFLAWVGRTFSRDEMENVLFSTSICFDLSIFELFGPLVNGGTALLLRDALALSETPPVPSPSLLNIVPSAAQALLEASAVPHGLRAINLAGEPLHPVLVAGLHAAVPGARICNLYGPTENTTYATWSEIAGGAKVTIGRPLDGTQIYILDRQLQPVPIGVSGEIHLAGAGLARGYWKQPALTADRFIPDPFGAPGSRMFRSGDVGRYRSDGDIEFLGRVDDQVKIRGYRIEPGEVEGALLRCAGVTAALVAMYINTLGEQQLVAYVVGDESTLEREVRSQLTALLPDYMVPTAFIYLDALPQTPNGKIDRSALPPPGTAASVRRSEYMPPRTPTEELLAQVWAEVLKLERVGRHDNFFALGGHSLLATRVVARVRQTLHADVQLRELFAAPTVAEFARAVQSARSVRDKPIAPRTRSGPSLCSFAQQRMWFTNQLDPGSALYNMPGAWRVRGPLNVTALEWAINKIVERHEILRTSFAATDGIPKQIIADRQHVPLPVVGLAQGADAEETVQEIVEQEGGCAFNIENGPLIRARLIKVADQEHVLLLTLHHLIADGGSTDVLIDELRTLYEAFTADLGSPLPDPPIQYSDFAVWQRERLRGDKLRGHLEFWSHYLEGARKELELPTDRPRPPVASHRGAWIGLDLSPQLSAQLRELNRRAQVTHFMTMAAAFGVLLHRYSGQDDICIGYPVANRDREELESLIGLFVNMLVLRVRFSPRETFETLLAQVRASVLDASAHQELPFEKLVEELRSERDPSHQPLFQVVLSTLEQRDPDLPGLELTRLQPFDRTSKFDMTLFVADTRDSVAGGIEYATDLFSRATMERLVGHLTTVLDAVATEPGARIDTLPILAAAERHQLLCEWNDTAAKPTAAVGVHVLVEQQALEHPDALAVVGKGGALSYRELNARANQLAHHLRSLGLGRDNAVAICLESSVEMAVGLLGILKAGAAYVSLDPDLPRARLGHMLADSNALAVVSREALKDRLPAYNGPLLCLDCDRPALERQPSTNPQSNTTPLNLAYCIFTSGSTGRPKGIEVPHEGLLNLIAWHRQCYNLGRDDRISQFAGVSFDAYGWQVWACFAAGATLHLVDEEIRRAPNKIPAWLLRKQITHCFLPTPLAEGALAETWPDGLSLRTLLTGGDTLHRGAREGDSFQLINHYGPTECSVVATCGITGVRGKTDRLPTIGRPIRSTQIYILDARGEVVPAGVIGELYIGGAGLARGYRNGPEITADRFIPNPFSVSPGARLYRTGDLGRHLANGEIELVGRIDRQIKVRGSRVELGEIEAVLATHDTVRECVVTVVEDPTRGNQLIAYIVPKPGADGDPQEWRDHLKKSLPEPLVPASYVLLDALPLLPSGKVDRRALPVPERLGTRADYVAPRNPIEETIASIWCELLPLDRVGVYDNFFACGGQSLLAAQAISRMREAFGVELPLRTFYEAPTIAELADTTETLRWISRGPLTDVGDPSLERVYGEI